MDEAKKQRLEAKGWKVGSVDEFLGLSPAEAAYIELKLILSEALRTSGEQKKLTHDLWGVEVTGFPSLGTKGRKLGT